MAYNLSWETSNPGLMVFLVDQSGSMSSEIGSTGKKRCEIVSEHIQTVLMGLVNKCVKGTAIRNKFRCIIIGYGADVAILSNDTAPEINAKLKNGQIIAPVAYGLTPMDQAFKLAKDEIEKWIKESREKELSLPAPHVVNITDGRPELGKDVSDETSMKRAIDAAKELMKVETEDGKVFLGNIFISNGGNVAFPSTEAEAGANKWAQFLFNISSTIEDETILATAHNNMLNVKKGAHCMMSTNDTEEILKFIDTASHPQVEGAFLL